MHLTLPASTGVEEVEANRDVCLSESLETLPILNVARIHSSELAKMTVGEIYAKIVEAIELPVA